MKRDDDLPVRVEERGDHWLVSVHGDFDRVTAPDVLMAVTDALTLEPRDVLLDLSMTTFLDGGGLATISTLQQRCEELGRALAIDARMARGVKRALAIVGLQRLVTPPPS